MSEEYVSPQEGANSDPLWDCVTRVHDWRNHVGQRVRDLWSTLTREQRLAVALDAEDKAANEDWE